MCEEGGEGEGDCRKQSLCSSPEVRAPGRPPQGLPRGAAQASCFPALCDGFREKGQVSSPGFVSE